MREDTVWRPHVTVAAVIEREGRFLMVEEHAEGRVVYNQPAGHLEPGESLIEAAIRECLEETAYPFEPQAVTGIYRWIHPGKKLTFLRVAFCGHCGDPDPERPLDGEIVAAHWLTRDELAARPERLRSPMVLRCIDDYLGGIRGSLELFQEIR